MSPAQRTPPVGSLGSCGGLPDVLGHFWFSFVPSQVLPSLSPPWVCSETTGRKALWPPQWAQTSPAHHGGEGPRSLSYSHPTVPLVAPLPPDTPGDLIPIPAPGVAVPLHFRVHHWLPATLHRRAPLSSLGGIPSSPPMALLAATSLRDLQSSSPARVLPPLSTPPPSHLVLPELSSRLLLPFSFPGCSSLPGGNGRPGKCNKSIRGMYAWLSQLLEKPVKESVSLVSLITAQEGRGPQRCIQDHP